MEYMVWPGEEKAWDILSNLDPKDVTANAKALFNSSDSTYASWIDALVVLYF
jgi:hypothetical protein